MYTVRRDGNADTKPPYCATARCSTTTSSRSGCGAGLQSAGLCAFRYPGRILAVREAIPLNVLLAEGLNLGLSKMAEASNTHDFHQLSCPSRWHIECEAIDRALAMVIETQAQLPMSRF